MRSRKPKVLHDLCGLPMLAWVVAAAERGRRRRRRRGRVARDRGRGGCGVPGRAGRDPGAGQRHRPRGRGRACGARRPRRARARPVGRHAGDPCRDGPRGARGRLGERRRRRPRGRPRAAPARLRPGRARRSDTSSESSRRATRAPTSSGSPTSTSASTASAPPRSRPRSRRVEPHNAQGERYLTDAVALLEGSVVAVDEVDVASCAGINSMLELAAVDDQLRRRLLDEAMLAGVRIVDPANTWIDRDVTLAPGSRIEPFCQLRAGTSVAEDAVVGPYVAAHGAEIGRGCRVGPFAYLRPGTVLHERAVVGRFVELKGAEIGSDSKVPHLSYLGDVTVGQPRQHRRRHDHGKLRRAREAPHRDRRRRPHEQQLGARRARSRRDGRDGRSGIGDHRGCSGRRARDRPSASDCQGGVRRAGRGAPRGGSSTMSEQTGTASLLGEDLLLADASASERRPPWRATTIASRSGA